MDLNCNLLFFPLLCIPMLYQCWLLWGEYHDGFAPQIYHRQEHVTDLPGITLCLPFKYAFPEAFIRHRIYKSGDDPLNKCARYKELMMESLDSHRQPHKWLAMQQARDDCYTAGFLWSDPADPLFHRNFTSLAAQNGSSLTVDDSFFLTMSLFGEFKGMSPDIRTRNRWVVRPNMMSYDRQVGLCWTWFSRSSYDWINSARYAMSQKDKTWLRTQDGDLVSGDIVSRDRPREWPYRVGGVRFVTLQLDFLAVLQHWYGIAPPKNLTAVQEYFTKYSNMESDFPIHVAAHSPYELSFNGLGSSYASNLWSTPVVNYFEDAIIVLTNYNLSSFTTWALTYSKTTLQHVSSPNRYSLYLSKGRNDPTAARLRGYSHDDCQRLTNIIDQIKNHVKKYPNESICIPMESLALSNWRQVQLDPLELPFCQPTRESSHLASDEPNQEVTNQQILNILTAKRPKQCPIDGTRIVFKFKSVTQGTMTRKQYGSGPDFRKLRHIFTFKIDPVPELTIKYVYKMSTIELLANGCGLCGIWIGFSFLAAIRWSTKLVRKLKMSHVTRVRNCLYRKDIKKKCNHVTHMTNTVKVRNDHHHHHHRHPLRFGSRRINPTTSTSSSSTFCAAYDKFLFDRFVNLVKLKQIERKVGRDNRNFYTY